MNHIDAIEGTVRAIIQSLHEHFVDGNQDDSEYIRNIRLAINGAVHFVAAHPELMTPQEVLKEVLYRYAKKLWMETMDNLAAFQADPEPRDYRDYYFDYLYDRETYPY
jgi:hypothetical protein